LSRDELARLGPAEVAQHRASASRQLTRCGAHYVVDSVAELLPIIDAIEGRLARGERP
jgi:phosphonoacetaldehyde hydrolase